ncbi:hypothetical protein N9Q58_00080 [Polaribacter sp.]|nr:hypothetical protein [Polaribacter sp.]
MKVNIKDSVSSFNIKRLANLFPSNLSFNRRLLQKASREAWEFKAPKASLNSDGFGRYIVEIVTPMGTLSFIAFSQYLEPKNRTDRVIAVAWDAVFALCHGQVNDEFCNELQSNLIKQESGRYSSRILCISRANKSVRMFEKVIDALVKRDQPCNDDIIKIGYLYRTTAVYGNGKFGMADFKFLFKNTSLDFPFAAQMLTVYLVREFSYYQVNHIAKNKSKMAIGLSEKSKRNLGIGNSTGLGMAPFLIKHSKPVGCWIAARENSLKEICQKETVSDGKWEEFLKGLKMAVVFFYQSHTNNELQKKTNIITKIELESLIEKLRVPIDESKSWESIFEELKVMNVNFQTQEVVISLLLELYPKTCDSFFVSLNQDEDFQLIPQMSLIELKALIKSHYSWVNQYDFNKESDDYYFWYYSENKEEPRLGIKTKDAGAENQMPIGIAKEISRCANFLEKSIEQKIDNVAAFLGNQPQMRSIVKRIQYMGQDANVSEIHINALGKDVLPTDLLRCKLALLGAMKFDPKSDKWVKVTFFQGTPLSSELPKLKHGVEHLFPIIK